MKKLAIALVCALGLFALISALAYQYLGMGGVVGVILLTIGGLYALMKSAGRMFEKAIKAPFKMKGSVLKNATVKINSINPASAPTLENSDESDAETRSWYEVDLSVAPQAQSNGQNAFRMWEPGELRLVSSKTTVEQLEQGEDDSECCEVAETKIWEDNSFVMDEGFKFEGEKRLLMLVGVSPDTSNLKFQYYFEMFGELALPKQ